MHMLEPSCAGDPLPDQTLNTVTLSRRLFPIHFINEQTMSATCHHFIISSFDHQILIPSKHSWDGVNMRLCPAITTRSMDVKTKMAVLPERRQMKLRPPEGVAAGDSGRSCGPARNMLTESQWHHAGLTRRVSALASVSFSLISHWSDTWWRNWCKATSTRSSCHRSLWAQTTPKSFCIRF